MKKLLELKNLKNTFYKQDGNRKYSVYHDPINHNLIVFSPYDNDTDIESVCNSIRNSAYNYLTDSLNEGNNLLVHWSQVEGTTSDYTIYYDFDITTIKNKTYKEIIKLLSQIKNIPLKYTEVKNGIAISLKDVIDSYNIVPFKTPVH
jgi:hypothetical protein